MKLRSALPKAALPKAALSTAALAALAALTLSACVPNNAPSTEAIAVSSTADKCTLSAASAPAGPVVFTVTNDGEDVTEFYLLAEDGLRIVSELENLGPDISRDMIVSLPQGSYIAMCKPGMVGDGLKSTFTVTASESTVAANTDRDQQLATASDQYILYVRDQVEKLVTKTDAFTAAYVAGDDDTARKLYADARVHWERIEPVAESFGDLDPMMDAREADLAEGEEWTGWHHIEKSLWPPAEGYDVTQAQREALATKLVADTATLSERVNADGFTIDAFKISNGAKELLDEVASGKITGEEEAWSHTDLWDFQANVDGAAVAFGVLSDIVKTTDPELADELQSRFDELNALLAQYGSVDEGFVLYPELTEEQVQELANAVNALSEPLSKLTAAVVL